MERQEFNQMNTIEQIIIVQDQDDEQLENV